MMLNCRKIIGEMINWLLRPLNLEMRSRRAGFMDIDKISGNVSQTQLYLYLRITPGHLDISTKSYKCLGYCREHQRFDSRKRVFGGS